MEPLPAKLVLSLLGIVAMLTGSAFAQKPRHVIHVSQSAAYDSIPGYDKDGSVIGIAAAGYDTNSGILGLRPWTSLARSRSANGRVEPQAR